MITRRRFKGDRCRSRAIKIIFSLLPAGLLITACGTPASPAGGPTASGASGTITVFAAASLTESFTELGTKFESAHPDAKINFSFGSSSTLATQITEGAPADVFAAANETTMKSVTDAGAGADPTTFVTNTLEIAVPSGNPGKINSLRDFGDEAKAIAICAPQVPCGSAAEQVFQAAKITAKPDTLEQDVKAALQKVALNEVDAALVYRTDVVTAGDKVEGIEFPEADQAVNKYPISTLTESQNSLLAQAFVDFVLGSEGQQVMREAGFGQP